MVAQNGNAKPKRRPSRRRVDQYLDALAQAVEARLAGGTDPLPAPLKDEPAVAKLHRALSKLGSGQTGAEEMAAKVQEVASGLMAATREQASSATEQAASVSEITTTIQELNEVAVQNVEKTEGIIELAQQSEQISQDGQRDVVAAVDGMDALGKKVELIAATILDLTERTQQIGEIIATVNEIAEQSKLLALNASIEAARAGEHGRGFSVVALEIRNLADQSKQATKQVRSILSEIQKASHSAAMATEEGSNAANAGSTKVRRIGERLGQLVYVITQASRASRQINAAMKQQSAGLDQITRAMRHINESTQQTKAGIDQASTSLKTLTELTDSIRSGP